MPLTVDSPTWQHVLQNLSLIVITLLLAPLCTLIAVCSWIMSPLKASGMKNVQRTSDEGIHTTAKFQPRIVLVTGVGMSKGLAIARAFYRQGHEVIGADFEPFGIPVCGRFSRSLTRFYRLPKPALEARGSKTYVGRLLEIVSRERVDLWVSCSGVASAIDDAQAAEYIEKHSTCRAIQFGVELTTKLHEKHSFIKETQRHGLNVPETHLVESVEDAISLLHTGPSTLKANQWVMKSIGLDDSVRGDMTLLPRSTVEETRRHVVRLRPSAIRPFVLQRYIEGPEYCTHSIIVNGQVVAFTACPSADMLMHYKALAPSSSLARAMQTYTESYVQKLGDVTGHFSIDFILDNRNTTSLLTERLNPIECNPRAHTAVILFNDDSKGMVDAYLTALDHQALAMRADGPVVPSLIRGYYWIGHDIITRFCLPLASLITSKRNVKNMRSDLQELVQHLTGWNDGTHEIWDPWVFWWMYCVYWPGMLMAHMLTQQWWSKANISTNKIFNLKSVG